MKKYNKNEDFSAFLWHFAKNHDATFKKIGKNTKFFFCQKSWKLKSVAVFVAMKIQRRHTLKFFVTKNKQKKKQNNKYDRQTTFVATVFED